MQSQEFADFVASQQEDSSESAAAKLRANKQREEWLQSLDDLYKRIDAYLDKFVKQKSIKIGYKEITLQEEGLGRYNARRMDISIGRQSVTLEPIGTLLIGSRGRVDVRGVAGQRQLIYVNAAARSAKDLIPVTLTTGTIPPSPPARKASRPYAWKIVIRDREATFIDLDKDSLYGLLMEVAGGG